MAVKGITILLVEDNPDDIEITKRAFQMGKVSNTLYIVRDGQEASEFLHHQGKYTDKDNAPRPGLILLDIRLPKIDGFEVLRRLKSDPNFKKIPVVMLTVSDTKEDINRCYNAGANSYIVKPVEFDKFVHAVKSLYLYWTITNTLPKTEEF